jgi:hypothetical protein
MARIDYVNFKPEKVEKVTKFEKTERKYLMFIGSSVMILFFVISLKYFLEF